jgi:Ig-like domain from next to BRCA1 gene/Bacterial Ig domain
MLRFVFFSLLFGALLLVSACSLLPTSQATQPTVIINSPPSGANFQADADVAVQSTSSDSAGVVRVELFVDGGVIRFDTPPGGQPQSQFSVVQTWKAAGVGSHVVTVRATNSKGATGEAAINVNVQTAVAQNATAAPSANIPTSTLAAVTDTPAPPANTAPPVESPTNTLPPPCVPNSQFIADVTIPDGTVMAAGNAFVKTWRVRNSGSCGWDSGYTIVRVAGEQMGASSPGLIPPAAPGATIDISVSMVAPAAPGTHGGTWRLRASNGVLFGTNLTVVINVPGPPTAPPTNTSIPPSITATSTNEPTNTPVNTPTNTSAPPAVTQVLKQVSIAANATGEAAAACPSGSVVTGGGYASNSALDVYNSSLTGNGWHAFAKNNTAASQLLNAYAICASNVPGSTTQAVAQVPVAGGAIGHATAACPAGTILTGGGFAKNTGIAVYNLSASGNGWQAYGKNNTAGSLLLNVYAICYHGAGANSTQVVNQISVGNGATGHAVASCPAGQLVTGGGFAGGGNLAAKTMDKSGSAWEAYVDNHTGATQLFNAYAVCTAF